MLDWLSFKESKAAYYAAFIGVFLNILLSNLVPALLGSPANKYLGEVSSMFSHHKDTLVSSSAIIGVAVFLSVVISTHAFNL